MALTILIALLVVSSVALFVVRLWTDSRVIKMMKSKEAKLEEFEASNASIQSSLKSMLKKVERLNSPTIVEEGPKYLKILIEGDPFGRTTKEDSPTSYKLKDFLHRYRNDPNEIRELGRIRSEFEEKIFPAAQIAHAIHYSPQHGQSLEGRIQSLQRLSEKNSADPESSGADANNDNLFRGDYLVPERGYA